MISKKIQLFFSFFGIVKFFYAAPISETSHIDTTSTQKEQKSAYLIKKKEFQEINSWYYLYLKKSLSESVSLGYSTVIIEIDTPGGRVDTALKIVNRLENFDGTVIIYINDNAISAGAIISLAADRLYIREGGIIGASTPVYQEGTEMKKAPEKINSVIRGKVRSLAQKNGRPADICEAMVDETITLTEKEHRYHLPAGKLLTLTAKESSRLNVTDATIRSLNELLDTEKISLRKIKKSKLSNSLHLLYFLSNPVLLGILSTIGMMGLIFEVRSPGWGVGGTVAVLSLSAFFIIQILLENAGWKIPALFAVGLVLIMLEIFIIPGFGLPGITGAVCLLMSLMLSFGIENWETGLTVVTFSFAAVVILSLILMKYLPDNKFFKNIALQDSLTEYGVEKQKTASLPPIGTSGVAKTNLRPVGNAEFDGKIHEVQAEFDYISHDDTITVSKVIGDRIFVNKKNR